MERPKRPYSIHSRPTKKRNRRIYYALFRNEAGVYTSAISTGCTRRYDALRWAEHHLELRKARRESTTFALYAEGFWRMDGLYAQSKIARGFTLSHGFLEVAEMNTRNHLIPVWGNHKLTQLNVLGIDAWVLQLRRQGRLASATINKLLQTLRIILSSAVADGLIPENPAQYVKPVRLRQLERGTLVVEEITRLLTPASTAVAAAAIQVAQACRAAMVGTYCDLVDVSLRRTRAVMSHDTVLSRPGVIPTTEVRQQ